MHDEITPDLLGSVAHTAASFTSLPAVATQDWCERAARIILSLRSDALVEVTVGEFATGGTLLSLEASGAVSGTHGSARVDAELIRSENAASVGWWLDYQDGYGGRANANRLAAIHATETWRHSEAGRRWNELGLNDTLVGLTPLHVENPDRLLLVEMGVRSHAEPFDDADALVLEAVLPELARRAAIAYGNETSNPMNRITPREQLILEQLTIGKTVKEIAHALSRSPHTIHDHVKSLHRKLNASSRGELVARALGHIERCSGRSNRSRAARDRAVDIITRDAAPSSRYNAAAG